VKAEEVVNDYFAALARRDVEAMAALWVPDGQEHIASQVDAVGPNGVRAYFTELFTAFPDLALTVERIPPGPPHEAFNQNTEQARESMRKLAALDPSAAWPGHADPLTGDVRAQLERAAGP
jgi:ketosteroid isomerase-like protein